MALIEDIERAQSRLRAADRVLVGLSNRVLIGEPPFVDVARELLRAACDTIGVTQSGLWLFDQDHQTLFRFEQYHRETRSFADGSPIRSESFPPYLNALNHERFIAIQDTYHDPRTISITAGPFSPGENCATLDTPIRSNGRVTGILHIQDRFPRLWSGEETSFAASVADFASIALEREARKKAESDARRANEDLTAALENISTQSDSADSKLAAIVQSSSSAILSCDLEGRIQAWSPGAQRVFGYTPDEIIGRTVASLAAEENLAQSKGILARALNGESLNGLEVTRRRKDGSPVNLLIDIAPIRSASGEVTGVLAMAHDITERHRAELALRESETRFRMLADFAPVLIWMSDKNERGIYFNKRWLDFTGRPLENELGDGWMESVHPDDRANLEIRADAVHEQHPFSTQFRLRRHDGAYRWMADAGTPRSVEGQFVGFIGSCFDITERIESEKGAKQINEELEHRVRLRTEDLQRSNAELEQFAYVASHDLQEPLRKIGNFTQLLANRYQGKLDESADKWIAYVVSGTARMHRLIEDLLAYSRVGRANAPQNPVNLGTIWDDAAEDLMVNVSKNEAQVTRDVMPDLLANSPQLRQVFRNLITNALKFRGSEAPRIHAWAERRAIDWLVSVKDNGIGIDPKYAERIFVIFQRLHSKEAFEGTGIGLAICKKIIENHGGKIWVVSQPGQGATFQFTLPVQT